MRFLLNPRKYRDEADVQEFSTGLRDPARQEFIAATEKGRLLGWVTFAETSSELFIDYLRRLPGVPRGLGRRLLLEVAREARRRGKECITLFPPLDELCAYYKGLGFSPVIDSELQEELDSGNLSMESIEGGSGLAVWSLPVGKKEGGKEED